MGLEGQLGLVKVHDGVSGLSELENMTELKDYAPKNLLMLVSVGYNF